MPHTIDSAIIEIERRLIDCTKQPQIIGVWSLLPNSGKTYFMNNAINNLSTTSGSALMLPSDPEQLLLVPAHVSYLFIDCGFSKPHHAEVDRHIINIKLASTIGKPLDTSVFIYDPQKRQYSSFDLERFDIAIPNIGSVAKQAMTREAVLALRDECKPAKE